MLATAREPQPTSDRVDACIRTAVRAARLSQVLARHAETLLRESVSPTDEQHLSTLARMTERAADALRATREANERALIDAVSTLVTHRTLAVRVAMATTRVCDADDRLCRGGAFVCVVCRVERDGRRVALRRACRNACEGHECRCRTAPLCVGCMPDYVQRCSRCPTCRAQFCIDDVVVVDDDAKRRRTE